jgi:hypothetical protein
MKWKNSSDRRCTDRSNRAASSSATVVFPEPGGPVRITTRGAAESRLLGRIDLTEQPRHPTPSIRIHRQEVDDVGQPVPVCSLFQEEKRPRPAEATFLPERGCADPGAACLTPENAS